MTKHIESLSQAIEEIRDICGINKGSVTFTEIVEAVQALKIDATGLQNTNRLLNAEIDGVCNLVGAPNVGSLRVTIGGMIDRCRVLDESKQQGLTPKAVFLPVGLDMATADLIGSFAENLGQRLHYKQRQGYSGWSRDDWKDDCLRSLHTAEKPLDVAAFAVFAWHHDWSGSYEALVTMPGEFHLQPAGQVVNISINVEGDINGANLDEIVRQALNSKKLQDDGPVGFRTE